MCESLIMKRALTLFALLVGLALLGMLSSACTPQIPPAQVEQELVPFMLDIILKGEAGKAYQVRAGAQPWAEAPADAYLIVWAPPEEKPGDTGINYVNSDEPKQVWWYADGQLVKVTDGKNAIEQFRKAHFSGTSPEHGWGYFEFGILSVTGGNQEVKVYLGTSCGPLCGEGTVLTLQRNETGEWKIMDEDMKWIS